MKAASRLAVLAALLCAARPLADAELAPRGPAGGGADPARAAGDAARAAAQGAALGAAFTYAYAYAPAADVAAAPAEPAPGAAEKATPEKTGPAAAGAEPGEGEPAEVGGSALKLEARRAALALLESDISAKLSQLQALERGALEQLDAKASAAKAQPEVPSEDRAKDLKKLVSLYESMKPKKAAELLEQLPLDTAVTLVRAMKPRPAGKILNETAPALGARISQRLAEAKR